MLGFAPAGRVVFRLDPLWAGGKAFWLDISLKSLAQGLERSADHPCPLRRLALPGRGAIFRRLTFASFVK